MVRRRVLKKVESLQRRIEEHREKIKMEQEKVQPDEGLIVHWEREIRAFEDAILMTRKRLKT